MVRIGSALFNADHTRLGEELRRVEAAGVDFWHLDVFDGHFVPSIAFSVRTIELLRPLSDLPFEVHLAATNPLELLSPLKAAGADLVFLPAEATPLPYESIYATREAGLRAGLCLALGTPLSVLEPVLPLLDSVLLLARVTGEGTRGREWNPMVLDRLRRVKAWVDEQGLDVDLQVAGGVEAANLAEVVAAGASSVPLGGALHRESDARAFLLRLRDLAEPQATSSFSNPSGSATDPGRRWRVLLASRSFGKSCPEVLDRLDSEGCELVSTGLSRAPNEEEMLGLVGDVDAIVSGTEPITAAVVERSPRLRAISKHGVGYENIDLRAAKERGIPVAIAAGAITDSVADMTLGLLLSLARGIPADCKNTRAGEWRRSPGMELRGKTLGLVGLGQIGQAVARRAIAFGMEVVAYDAYPSLAFATAWGVRLLSLEDLLSSSHVVSLHAPLTPETEGLIGAERLAMMRPGALLINTARGGLVDEAALLVALDSGQLAGAASDVFRSEPPGDSPLLGHPRFLPTAHNAGQTAEGLRRMGEITAENLLRMLRGGEPLHRVA